jgi:hypothetical protein
LQRETFEATIPHMTLGAVMAIVAAGKSGQQPLHRAAEVTIGNWSRRQVKVVRHQTTAQSVDRQSCA